jgi:hypothetical protein
LQALNIAHEQLWQKHPENYGVTSGVLAFLMQSVIFTPPRVNWYVRDALAALRFQETCDRFGMFFFEVEDPYSPLLEINIDNNVVARYLKITNSKKHPTKPERLKEEEDPLKYPLGADPTWNDISLSLQGNPTILIPEWCEGLPPTLIQDYGSCGPESAEFLASKIFVKFTKDLWSMLNDAWRRDQSIINPTSLADALRCWSLDFLLERLKVAEYKPCKTGSDGGPGRRSMKFSRRREIFFPKLEPSKTSKNTQKLWKLMDDFPGYIWQYRNIIGANDRISQRINECLEVLLDQCQCLPESSTSQYFWHTTKQKLIILTNIDYYRIRKVGIVKSSIAKKANQGIRAPPAHRSYQSVWEILFKEEGHDPKLVRSHLQKAKKTKQKLENKSKKLKNYRVPPKKRKKSLELFSEVDLEPDEKSESHSNGERSDFKESQGIEEDGGFSEESFEDYEEEEDDFEVWNFTP